MLPTRDLADRFLAAKTAKGLSPHTLETYRYRLMAFARENPDLPLSPEPIEGVLIRAGPTPETKHQHFRITRTFYRWLRKRGVIEFNPIDLVEPPRLIPKVARALSMEEITQLLQYPHDLTMSAFLWLLTDTGLRLSEALRLDKDNAHTETVKVTGKVGEREVPISGFVRDMVFALPGRCPFGGRWSSRQAAGLAVRRAFRRAGINGKRASAQTLRHTFVRQWTGDENMLVGILGWTSPRMLKVYLPYNIDRAVQQHREHSLARKVFAAEEQ